MAASGSSVQCDERDADSLPWARLTARDTDACPLAGGGAALRRAARRILPTIFKALWQCLLDCWDGSIFSRAGVRFLKHTMQLLAQQLMASQKVWPRARRRTQDRDRCCRGACGDNRGRGALRAIDTHPSVGQNTQDHGIAVDEASCK